MLSPHFHSVFLSSPLVRREGLRSVTTASMDVGIGHPKGHVRLRQLGGAFYATDGMVVAGILWVTRLCPVMVPDESNSKQIYY